jgi:CheY-like chemotaxis protein
METPPAVPLTIILVEDNPVDVSVVRWVLTAHALPYALHVIENGDDALEVFDLLAAQDLLRTPTIVLLDLNLPQLDGREVLRHLKALPQGAALRVVVVTGSHNPADRRDTLTMGADAYFVKPFHLHDFMPLGALVKQMAFAPPHGEGNSLSASDHRS